MNIGTLSNYYGRVAVEQNGGKYYWTLDNWDSPAKEEIPEYLYKALVKFELERTKEIN